MPSARGARAKLLERKLAARRREEYLILSHRGEFLKPPQSAHSAAARVTCKESASMSVSRRFLTTARYACQSGDSQECRYRTEAGQKSERFLRKQKLYLVSEEGCSMRRLLNSSESRVRKRCRPARSPPKRTEAGWSESHVRATLTTYKKSFEENRRSDQQRVVRRPMKRTNGQTTLAEGETPERQAERQRKRWKKGKTEFWRLRR